jgi:HSP20 family molecular chaperone IbpA
MDMDQNGLRREADSRQATPLVPAVDVWEDGEGITLVADLPGVSKETLSLGIEGETLTISGTVALGESAKLRDVYAEIRVAQYRRSFVLGRDLDPEKISAQMKNGILQLRIPKREAAKPRKISVQVG